MGDYRDRLTCYTFFMAIIRFRKSTEIQLNLNSVGFSDWVKIPDKIDARRVSLHVAPDANVTFNLDIQSTNKETITENLNDRFIRNTEAEGITQEAFYQADSTVSGIRINLKSFTPDPDNADSDIAIVFKITGGGDLDIR